MLAQLYIFTCVESANWFFFLRCLVAAVVIITVFGVNFAGVVVPV